MKDILDTLSGIFKKGQTVAVMGCGSRLLGDDAAGCLVAERLTGLRENARSYCCGAAPENFTGEIKRLKPDVLLVVDAADMSLPAGSVALIPPDRIDGASFSTHMLPLNIMLDYLRSETGCAVYLLGIQGVCLEFGADMTPEVSAAVDAVVYALGGLLAAG